jgi:hypothetical protein
VARVVGPAPVASVAPAGPASFDFFAEEPTPGPRGGRRRRKRGGGWVGLAVLGGVLALAAGLTLAFLPKIKELVRATVAEDARAARGKEVEDPVAVRYEQPRASGGRPKVVTPAGPKVAYNPGARRPTPSSPLRKPGPTVRPPADPVEPPFRPGAQLPDPRRALIISVHNYLYANPISDGPSGTVNVARLKSVLNLKLRIPNNQIFRLTDALDEPTRRPPLKGVIEQGLVSFLKTTRKQDRVMVFFIGHTKEVDNEAYLMPLEGEFDDVRTMIPLKWVYEEMAKCNARQKVLVIDGNRSNAAQGEERPKSGPMGEKFQAMLKSPPAGVQVWSACSAGQESHEFDDAPVGHFLNSLRLALAPEKGMKGALEGRIPQRDDLIPMAQLNDAVNARMEFELSRRKLKQTAFVSGSPAGGAAYDKNEPPPAPPVFGGLLPPGSQRLVKEIMSEISVPTLRGTQGTGADVAFNTLPPFSPDAMKPYEGGAKADDKLRQAIHEARVTLWAVSNATPPPELAGDVAAMKAKLKAGTLEVMRDRFSKPGAGRAETVFKNQLFENLKQMARIVSPLEDALDKLKEVENEKDKAPKRWQANYAYVLARLYSQLAFLEEYESLLGSMRKEFPPHDPAVHNGWKMASKEKASDSGAKKYDKKARALYAEAAKKFKGTPWEVLAKREKLSALGLEWQAY